MKVNERIQRRIDLLMDLTNKLDWMRVPELKQKILAIYRHNANALCSLAAADSAVISVASLPGQFQMLR